MVGYGDLDEEKECLLWVCVDTPGYGVWEGHLKMTCTQYTGKTAAKSLWRGFPEHRDPES